MTKQELLIAGACGMTLESLVALDPTVSDITLAVAAAETNRALRALEAKRVAEEAVRRVEAEIEEAMREADAIDDAIAAIKNHPKFSL